MSANDGRLANRIALVTGSASGIGEACARAFARHGATVFVSDVNAEQGVAVAADIGEAARFLPLDVCDPSSWQAALAKIEAQAGGLDILVNNAGGGRGGGPIGWTELDAHRAILELNVTGVWQGIKAALPLIEARAPLRSAAGSIVNISSIDGLVGVEGLSSYASSKFAVTGLTRSLALELGPRNIRVNAVHPGIIATPMVNKNTGRSMERLRNAVAHQPIARMGRPEEIADAVVFFASDESSFCTGASLVVDGGHIAGPYRDPLGG